MATIEEKLKLENEITRLSRDLKLVLAHLDGAKKEYAAVTELKERNERIIEEQQQHLEETLQETSSARLAWSTEKTKEFEQLERQKLEVKEILDTRELLNAQQREIDKTKEEDIEIRNDTRRLQLALDEKSAGLEVREKAIEAGNIALAHRETLLENRWCEMKDQAAKIIKLIDKS